MNPSLRLTDFLVRPSFLTIGTRDRVVRFDPVPDDTASLASIAYPNNPHPFSCLYFFTKCSRSLLFENNAWSHPPETSNLGWFLLPQDTFLMSRQPYFYTPGVSLILFHQVLLLRLVLSSPSNTCSSLFLLPFLFLFLDARYLSRERPPFVDLPSPPCLPLKNSRRAFSMHWFRGFYPIL